MNIETMEAVVKNVWCVGGSGAVEVLTIASNIY
jgi:hypothetical protein